MGFVANLPTCRPLLTLSPALKPWELPIRQGLCGPSAHLWASVDFVSRSTMLGTPDGRGYVANVPTCGPQLTWLPALKLRGAPIRQGLCAHLPTTGPLLSLFPAPKRWGSPTWQGLCSQFTHMCAIAALVPLFEVLATPRRRGYVANPPTCRPLLSFFAALQCWGPNMTVVMYPINPLLRQC